MSYEFSARSRRRLEGVHPYLVEVMERALEESPLEFSITEGVRSLDRQRELFNSGKSRTMKSKHLIQKDGYSHAVDIAVIIDGDVDWTFSNYKRVADVVKIVAQEQDVNIIWGGDWVSFRDGPHFQIENLS